MFSPTHVPPHLLDLASYDARAQVHLLVDVDYGPHQLRLDPPHLASSEVLLAEGQLHRVQRDGLAGDLLYMNVLEVLESEGVCNALGHVHVVLVHLELALLPSSTPSSAAHQAVRANLQQELGRGGRRGGVLLAILVGGGRRRHLPQLDHIARLKMRVVLGREEDLGRAEGHGEHGQLEGGGGRWRRGDDGCGASAFLGVEGHGGGGRGGGKTSQDSRLV